MADGESQAERLRAAIPQGKIRATARRLAEETGRPMSSHLRQLHNWLSGKGIEDDNAELLAKVLGKPKDHFKGVSLLEADEIEVLALGLTQVRAGLETLSQLQRRLARQAKRRSAR